MRRAEDALYVTEREGGIDRLLRVPYGPHPKVERIALPLDGIFWLMTDGRVPGVLFDFASWTKGYTIYHYDPSTRQVMETKVQPAGPYDNVKTIESIEVKAKSHDGVMVPLSIMYSKGLKRDGSNPTLLEGYGSYGYSFDAYFDPTRLAWYENGGVYAVCHARGGGE